MEFYRIAEVETSEAELQEKVIIESLPDLCDSMPAILECSGNEGRVVCLWGQFDVRRELINGGVRFTMPACPNALAWTVTTGYPPAPDRVVIHCTINRVEIDAEFKESFDTFLDDWKEGVEEVFRGAVSGRGEEPKKHRFQMI